MSEKLIDKYHIDDKSLLERKSFISLTERDRLTMVKMVPWAKRRAKQIVEAFYDWQFGFPATKKFFEKFADAQGISFDELRNGLVNTQISYLIQMFTGAENGWDGNYFENRLRIGLAHDAIALPTKWFIGSYGLYYKLIRTQLESDYRFRPFLRARVTEAILKVIN